MSTRIVAFAAAALLTCATVWALEKPSGKVCPDPSAPCGTFKSNDLSFPLKNDGKARAEQRSEPFFAVILKTAAPCATSEKERLELQALFPRHKVFANRFGCDDNVENNVSYSNTSEKHGFIAVYAGEDRAAAEQVLATVKATGRFAGANIRRMQVIFNYP